MSFYRISRVKGEWHFQTFTCGVDDPHDDAVPEEFFDTLFDISNNNADFEGF